MALLICYSLTCLSFLRISFSWILIIIDVFSDRLLSFSKSLEYRCHIHFGQYRTDFVFKKNVKMKVIWSTIDCFQSFSSLARVNAGLKHDPIVALMAP